MFDNFYREHRRSAMVRNLAEPHLLPEQGFDRLVTAAASAFMAPIAAVSLIHGGEQAIKASRGLPTGCIPREEGFCHFALDRPGVLECCDPQEDPRFATLPGVVGEPHVRYYIGAPLRLLSGIDVGALCVVDTVARQPSSDDQKAVLLGLARQAVMMIESRRHVMGHFA